MQTINNNNNNNNNITFIKFFQLFFSLIVLIYINNESNFDIQYNGSLSLLSYLNFTLIFLFLTIILQQVIEPLLINSSKIVLNSLKFLKVVSNLILAFFSIGLSMIGFKILKLIAEKLDQIELVKNIILIRIWSKEQLLIELINLTTFLNLNLTESEQLELINSSTNYSTLKLNLLNLLNLKNQPIVEQNLPISEKIKLAFFNLIEFFYTSPILSGIVVALVVSSMYIIFIKTIAITNFLNNLNSLSKSNAESIETLTKTVQNLKPETTIITEPTIIATDSTTTNTQIENLKQGLESKIDKIDTQIKNLKQGLESKIDKIDTQIEHLDTQLNQAGTQLAHNHLFQLKTKELLTESLNETNSLKNLMTSFATKHNSHFDFDTLRFNCLERSHNQLIANLKEIIPNFGSFFSIEDKDTLKTIITTYNQSSELKQITKEVSVQPELNQFHNYEQKSIEDIKKKLNLSRTSVMADILSRKVPKDELISATREAQINRYQTEYESFKILEPKK